MSTCLNTTLSSRSQKSPSQTTFQKSPVSPTPVFELDADKVTWEDLHQLLPFSPNAETSWLPESGDENRWEWRNFLVVKWWNRIVDPHSIGSLKWK